MNEICIFDEYLVTNETVSKYQGEILKFVHVRILRLVHLKLTIIIFHLE